MSYRSVPRHVSLRVRDEERAVEPIEILGHRAALRLTSPLVADEPFSLVLDWDGARTTTLTGNVRSVSSRRSDLHVVHLDVLGVAGDWRVFLEYLAAACGAATARAAPEA